MKMRRMDGTDLDAEVLIDTTESLTLHSKRTERARRKQRAKAQKVKPQHHDPFRTLPSELVLQILAFLKPSDIFRLQRVCKDYHKFILDEESRISKTICAWRYSCLEKCFRTPVLMDNMDETIRAVLQAKERQMRIAFQSRPYQHVPFYDRASTCSCLTCTLRWASLCLVLDFAHFQDHLDNGKPLPMIPRGKNPQWNQTLTASHATVVRKALGSPLWHARILEEHLRSTVRSIRRHAANHGNKRHRFSMTTADVESETDLFLERSGPPSLDFPYHRDNYYMLEAYMPNRGWNSTEEIWMYAPAEQHDTDIQFEVNWAKLSARRQEEDRRP